MEPTIAYMSRAVPLPPSRWRDDTRYLKSVAVLHQVWACLMLVPAFVLFALLFIGLMWLALAPRVHVGDTLASLIIPIFGSALCVADAVLLFRSARFIQGRSRREFSIRAGALNALTFVGVPLAVYTYAVLTRDSVVELYRTESGGASAPRPVVPVAAIPE